MVCDEVGAAEAAQIRHRRPIEFVVAQTTAAVVVESIEKDFDAHPACSFETSRGEGVALTLQFDRIKAHCAGVYTNCVRHQTVQ